MLKKKKKENNQVGFNTKMKECINIRKFINMIHHINRPELDIHHHICYKGL